MSVDFAGLNPPVKASPNGALTFSMGNDGVQAHAGQGGDPR